MKRLFCIAILASVISSGCEFSVGLAKAEKYAGAVDSAIHNSEGPVSALESAVPGYQGADPVAMGRAVLVADKTGEIASKVQAGAQSVGALVPAAKPVADGVAGVAGIIGGLAVSIGAFLRNRKIRKVAAAAMKAGDSKHGFGADVTAEAKAAGVADLAEKIYKEDVN